MASAKDQRGLQSHAINLIMFYNKASGDLVFSHEDGDTNDWLLHQEKVRSGTVVDMGIALDSNRTRTKALGWFHARRANES
jgi:hypothetical protein